MILCLSADETANRAIEHWPGETVTRPRFNTDVELSLPVDLVGQTEVGALLGWVDKEVTKFCEGDGASRVQIASAPGRRELLSVLTFAYARGVFASDDIMHRCRTDLAFRLLCHDVPPFAQELTSFRRRNRTSLVAVLAGVLSRLAKNAFSGITPSPTWERQLISQATARLNMARHLDGCSD